MGYFGLVAVIDGNAAAFIALQPGGGEVEITGGTGAPDAIERLVGDDLLAAFKIDADLFAALTLVMLKTEDLFAEAQSDPILAHQIDQIVGDLRIQEG